MTSLRQDSDAWDVYWRALGRGASQPMTFSLVSHFLCRAIVPFIAEA